MRIKQEYTKPRCYENQKAYLKDLEQSIDDFEKTGGKNEWFNNVGVNTPQLEKDKWEMGEDQLKKPLLKKQEILYEKKRELVEKAENELQGANNEYHTSDIKPILWWK